MAKRKKKPSRAEADPRQPEADPTESASVVDEADGGESDEKGGAGKVAGKKSAKKKSAKKSAKKSGRWADAGPIEMGRATKLVVVESPTKAKTINKYLGKDYYVTASMGHVRDLPRNRFGIDIENDFEPEYIEIYRKRKHNSVLRRAAREAEEIYLCPDPDREGEAIAWHLMEMMKVPFDKVRRVTFGEITQRAVLEAFQHPRDIDLDLVLAQQARRILDRLVGYKLSPLLWKKVIKRLSAGRVQSVAVRIICEREAEIEAFVPDEYWRIAAIMSAPSNGRHIRFDAELKGRYRKQKKVEVCPVCGGPMKSQKTPRGTLLKCTAEIAGSAEAAEAAEADGADDDTKASCPGSLTITAEGFVVENVELKNKEQADSVLAEIEGKPFVIREVTKRESKSRPGPPFSTSQLQQGAASRLRFTARKTMMVAQRLYEGVEMGPAGSVGLITYMRTDSFRIAPEALAASRKFIGARYGSSYLPDEPQVYKARKGAQEAHEGIRPTQVDITPESAEKYLEPDMFKLYRLIWQRFVASQMTPARYEDTSALVVAGDYVFPAHGRVVLFPGCTAVYGAVPKKGEEQTSRILPPLDEGQEVKVREVKPSQHFTQPPSRYSEASLVRTLEAEGIGRPSTYAMIITTIQARGYVRKEGSGFHATLLGRIVNDKLIGFFPSIMDVHFTAEMEERLDRVESGSQDWLDLVSGFYKEFERDLTRAEKKMPAESDKPAPFGEKCQECGETMVLKLSRKGRFLGCAKFPECRFSMPIDAEARGIPLPEAARGTRCPNCGAVVVLRLSRRGKFLGCTNFPKCRTMIPLDENDMPVELEKTDEVCDKCDSPMQVRMGRYGKFLSCTGYPKCRNAKPIPGSLPGEDLREATGSEPPKCEACGADMCLRRTKKGGYLVCVKLPDCKQKAAIDDELREKLSRAGKPLAGDEEEEVPAVSAEAEAEGEEGDE
jgi:DNA topoisomerase-1